MRKKILMAGFLSTLLVLLTFAGLATSVKLETQNEIHERYNQNLVTTSETSSIICDQLLERITYLRNKIIEFRERANNTENPILKRYFNTLVVFLSRILDVYVRIYEIACT